MSETPAATIAENGTPQVTEEASGFKVFAGNLAYSTTDEGLRTFFAPVEKDIISAQVIFRGNRSAGYGFVTIATAEAAQKAVENLDKQELDGRTIIVEIAKPADQKDQERNERKARRKPGRRGNKAVPGEVTEAEADGEAKVVDEVVGDADAPAKPKKKKKFYRRKRAPVAPAPAGTEGEDENVAVVATDGGETEPAAQDQTAPRKPRYKRPRVPRPLRAKDEAPVGEPSTTMLFVANLGFSTDDAALTAIFTDAGIHVDSARIVRRRWGNPRKSKGYGFVDVGSEEEQKKAIEALNGIEIGGRNIAVKIAVNTPRQEEDDQAPAEIAATPEATVVAT